MKPHNYHPQAAHEYRQAVAYYSAIAPGLSNRFYDEIERLVQAVRLQPQRFFELAPPARRALSQNFPYSIVFVELADRIRIIAVMHSKRKPGYWRHRLRP